MNSIQSIYDKVLSGVYPDSDDEQFINGRSMQILYQDALLPDELNDLKLILDLSNVLYNNTDRTRLPLEDGIYDLLVVAYERYHPYEVRGTPVQFNQVNESTDNNLINPIAFVDRDFVNDSLFINDEVLSKRPPHNSAVYESYVPIDTDRVIKKANVNVPHKYPKLVGTLDKCKFVLLSQAVEKGVANEPNVKIFERDFLGKHIQQGIINPNMPIDLVLELKYDGISVEADVTNKILSARTRGDTDADVAADLTPILGGFTFLNCPEIPKEEAFGMKFEAIITKDNLQRLCELRGISYVNCRVAMIGLAGASDAYKYRNFITLIPLETSLDIDRETELEFMNRYFNMGEYNRHAIIHANNYNEALFMVYKFVEEAERIRPIMPYMYDGVVVSYLDPSIKKILGREGAVNKYSIAIKFNPLKKQTVFLGYTYTVGMNGVITPMLHYNPVEFFGSIHTKSSGHSYSRFKELNLKKGDIIDLEYTNDVMPYATKANCAENDQNTNPYEEFPTVCPSCGTPLEFVSDKTAVCTNFSCPERVYNRASNMMKVLGIKDFAGERLKSLNIISLYDLANINPELAENVLGPVNGSKLLMRIHELLYSGMTYDYTLISSLGFSNISTVTWKKILKHISIHELLVAFDSSDMSSIENRMLNIKSIGPATVSIIKTEIPYFAKDLAFIGTLISNGYVKSYTGIEDNRPKVRFTGVRDQELEERLNQIGFDADGKASVTKDTRILIVPYEGFTSTKTNKVDNSKCLIVTVDDIKANPKQYYDAVMEM